MRARDLLAQAGLVHAAAEPQPSATMSEILADYVDNLHAPVPGGDALLTHASSEMRMNSREWKLSTTWFIRIGNYRDMVNVSVHITNTGTVLKMTRGIHAIPGLPELRLPGLTLERADANNAVAARTILGGCKKLLSQLPPRVTAAAEPEQAKDSGFSTLWLQFMPHERKVTSDGVTVTLESFDSASISIEISMPDGETYSVQEDRDSDDVRVRHVGLRKANLPVIPGETPARGMLQRILSLCVADWKKHKTTTTAAAEPHGAMTPADALRAYLKTNPGERTRNGVTFDAPPDHVGLYVEVIRNNVRSFTYHATPDFVGDSDNVRVVNTSRLSVEHGKTILLITHCSGVPDLLRQIAAAVIARMPGNSGAPVIASAEPERISGKWRGYCVKFDNGLTFPTDTGCKGTCLVQYEPSTGKVYQHGAKGFEHHGKTIADWAGTTRIPVAQTPVPDGGVPGIRLGYSLRFCDGVKLRTATGIRGTSAVYRDLETGKVYESGPDWYEIKLEDQA